MWLFLLLILTIITVILIQYVLSIKKAYKRLDNYTVKTFYSDRGRMSYLDEGAGEPVLISHGIFGGYDQGYETLKSFLDNRYRKISISRFGYPGSDLPAEPTPDNQAKVYLDLLNELKIERTYLITTSAGAAAGIKFAINYPDSIKGLILLSSGVPSSKKAREEITGPLGPPNFTLNDFLMCFFIKYFGFVFKSMFKSEIDDSLYNTMLPVNPRKQGIKADETITNLDMDINYDKYPVEKIKAPIIVIHAKDDPMVKFEGIKKFIARTNPQTAIFETGGHLITGNGDAVSKSINSFIKSYI